MTEATSQAMTQAATQTTNHATEVPVQSRDKPITTRLVGGRPKSRRYARWPSGLEGRSALMVNSTSVGGGVAEILNRMVPLMQELQLDVRWDVITGGDDFFAITKAFHNALHGGRFDLPDESFATFLAYTSRTVRGFILTPIRRDPRPAAGGLD